MRSGSTRESLDHQLSAHASDHSDSFHRGVGFVDDAPHDYPHAWRDLGRLDHPGFDADGWHHDAVRHTSVPLIC